MDDIIGDLRTIKALAYCVTQDQAKYMADRFNAKGVKSAVLTSKNSHDRVLLKEQLKQGKINVLFVVDIFNEGVDIPEIDTLLFLRPTESLTIFLQQLGRGLRLSDNKDCLTVLDFVGNGNTHYDFATKFRALVGKSHRSTIDEVEDDFPHLPLGCSIVLQKETKEVILANIRGAILNGRKLKGLISSYSEQTTRDLTLKNFLFFNPTVTLEDIYKIGWNKLNGDDEGERFMFDRAISTRFIRRTFIPRSLL
ncbi:MAG: helicase-related protein [Spirochaetaceae bacterium]|jgi:superfamily II DNA or RNA helicase|nr:helicase-related protein [Spirochaetaceae bacterium]